MDLIERYLQEIGRQLPRHLPSEQRADILAELRSSLMDTLEARFEGEPSENAVVQMIREMGSPQQVAASYHPIGQYLIGPELYPTFRLVLVVVFTAVIGAQLLAIVISLGLAQASLSILDEFWGIINSLPAALGMVVIVFAILQRLGVQTEDKSEAFDPLQLPQLEGNEQPVKRGEQVFGIIVGVIVLAFLSRFAMVGGFQGDSLFANPVIDQYFPWIALSMVIGIVIDIFLLWKGRWQTSTRIAKIAADIFSMVILFVLIQGHNAWLGEMGVAGFFEGLTQFSQNTELPTQVIGMAAFRIALTVAFIVTGVDTLVQLYRLIRSGMNVNAVKQIGVVPVKR